jgi:hypothetical protein
MQLQGLDSDSIFDLRLLRRAEHGEGYGCRLILRRRRVVRNAVAGGENRLRVVKRWRRRRRRSGAGGVGWAS